jgi:hypothetical protein
MAYPAGYIELNNERDVPLLKEVLHARFVTHSQLFELMQFAGIESCRETFNWRVKRPQLTSFSCATMCQALAGTSFIRLDRTASCA